MWLPWTTPTLHERDIGLTIYPKENWNATNSCPSSGDWTLKEENNATYSLVPMDYYVADGEGCKATYAFEGSQAVVMGRTNPDYGVYGCMLDGDTTWHSAASEENNYQSRFSYESLLATTDSTADSSVASVASAASPSAASESSAETGLSTPLMIAVVCGVLIVLLMIFGGCYLLAPVKKSKQAGLEDEDDEEQVVLRGGERSLEAE
ncbi:hypothetical protein BCR35DRAFT_334249 [Leucosporidium creatinivorum]|uniref:Uncharacterized protein n=1 Tax=Leucosporidium creatinivorum TaxID=106004 RepID=A0A1Y2EDS6_9BASI|nr:hypothetical protein BCR35DRAFT_334249 [Leucosporidium creatinivorum]